VIEGTEWGSGATGMDGVTVGAVELRHVPEFVAVTLTTQGNYAETAEPFARLKDWADHIGVMATGNAVCVFYGPPSSESSEPLRYSLCLPVSRPDARAARAALATSVARPARPAGGRGGDLTGSAILAEDDVVEVREFPRILAAVAYYRGSVFESIAAYGSVAAWVRGRPYLPTGAPRESYLVEPDRLRPGFLEVEVHQPVMPKAGGSRRRR
jgi:hypothetical protein